MSRWRVEQHYGFGAAQIPIRPEPHSSEMLGVMEGAVYLIGELFAGGPVVTTRRLVGQIPAMLLGMLLFAAFIATLARDRSDESPIEVVLFDSAEIVPDELPVPVDPPAPVIPEPIEVARLEPAKPIAPKPPPPAPQIAEMPKPAPPPPQVARPKPRPKARPRPMIPQIARVETPRIAKPKRIERARRARPLAPRPVPRMTAPAAPAPVQRAESAPRRSFRVASAKPVPGQHPRALPGLPPAPAVREGVPALLPRNALRTKRSRPASLARAPRIAPALDRAPVPAAPLVASSTADRATRPAPRPKSHRAPRPAAQIARANSAGPVTAPAPSLASRARRAVPSAPRGTSSDRPGLAGVPLGDLAACLSDREEDRLKQAVVAAVTTQKECVSSEGTYRFIETKNLNAFLMWIDRAPARAVSDRCIELGYALECLKSASQRAAR